MLHFLDDNKIFWKILFKIGLPIYQTSGVVQSIKLCGFDLVLFNKGFVFLRFVYFCKQLKMF